jgi:hypothetical protein
MGKKKREKEMQRQMLAHPDIKNGAPDRPHERLTQLGSLFRERDVTYGSCYHDHGAIMMALFPPHGITLTDEWEFKRYAIFMTLASKMARYAKNFFKGGHADSLNDIAVYSQMLAEVDELQNGRLKK